MKKLQQLNIFPTLISVIDFDEDEINLINEEIENNLNHLGFEKISNKNHKFQHNQTSLLVYSHDYVGAPKKTLSHKIEDCNLHFLKKNMLEQVDNYLKFLHDGKSLEELKLKIFSIYVWLIKMNFNDYFLPHHHSHLGITGVYYYKVPDNNSKIYFKSVDKSPEISIFSDRSDIYQVECKPGRMILFPGWTEHGTNQYKGSDDRIVLSFNIKIEKKQ